MKSIPFRTIILLWLAWVVIVIGFQALATARFQPQWPDRAQEWTVTATRAGFYQVGHPYLLEPFMNAQVAWDSEYYLAIAAGGYDNPQVPHLSIYGVTPPSQEPPSSFLTGGTPSYALSYAFLPFYPWVIWLVAWPFKLFLNPIAAATLAGVLVSALGALAGMLALYDLTRDSLDDEGALRAVFYMLIFPTAFFMVQVYTEGLFVGLAFSCLAMLKRGHWLPAALLGAAAALTRAVGVALVIPMAVTWVRSGEWLALDLEWRQIFLQGVPWRQLGKALLVFAPLIAFLMWKFSYLGLAFDFIENNFFGRGVLSFDFAFFAWSEAFKSMLAGPPPRTVYFLTEFLGLAIGIVTCFACLKHDPEVAWFSLAVLIISWGSGPAQGLLRYILGAPAVFIMLARWGKNPVFDRAWTMASLLLMGLLAMLFAFDFWVA